MKLSLRNCRLGLGCEINCDIITVLLRGNMQAFSSSTAPIIAALITASATLAIFLVTKIIEFFSAYSDRKRTRRMHLMAIKSELAVNWETCKAMLSSAAVPRTLGFRFLDDAWKSADRSVIYFKGIPTEDILKVYVMIQHYHLLVERRAAIRDQKNNYPNAEAVISTERDEMINIAKNLRDKIEITLQQFPN